jgi:hypothetical protein
MIEERKVKMDSGEDASVIFTSCEVVQHADCWVLTIKEGNEYHTCAVEEKRLVWVIADMI